MDEVDQALADIEALAERMERLAGVAPERGTAALEARILFLEEMLDGIDLSLLESASEAFRARVEDTENDVVFNAMLNRVHHLLRASSLEKDEQTELLVLASAVGQRVLGED